LERVKVVILGLEPWHEDGMADGLAWSCAMDRKTWKEFCPLAPLPLRNLHDELQDSGYRPPAQGSLKSWARQGVLLWNTRPTTLLNSPKAHLSQGWEPLTQEILETVYLANPKAVFVFMGIILHRWAQYLPSDANMLLLPGPYPFDRKEFEGSDPFKKINKTLRALRQRKINWNIE
jgi:uracil-DNA glycosylase